MDFFFIVVITYVAFWSYTSLSTHFQIEKIIKIILFYASLNFSLFFYICDLPREKGPNAAKPNFTREPRKRSLKSCTSGRIGRS